MIKELEAIIEHYKGEFILLISQTRTIGSEMERVQSKVDRSMTLLGSLGSEKVRWESSSKTFDTEMSTIVGDVLMSAAFLAYGGFFDQQYREMMWQEWSAHLSEAGIKFKAELSLPDYLSTADDRLSDEPLYTHKPILPTLAHKVEDGVHILRRLDTHRDLDRG